MRAISLPICVIAFLAVHSQARNANWVFSDGMWMHFTDTSMAMLPSPYSSTGRSSCLSDTTGEFLLLVDDTGIRDAQFNLLSGASTAELGWTEPGSSYLILPKPGAPTHYFILVNEMPPDARAGYVEIDLVANGGEGGVVSPGTTWYMQHATAKLTATTDVAEAGYWVVQHADSGNAFNAFHVTEQGLDPVPVISHAGRSYLPDAPGYINADLLRPMKFSFQGDKLAAITFHSDLDSNALELFHFNRTDGMFSFWAHITTDQYGLNPEGQLIPLSYGWRRFIPDMDFSPDGLHLYYLCSDTSYNGGQAYLVQAELGDPDQSAIQHSAFVFMGAGLYVYPGWDGAGGFLLSALDGSLYARTNNHEFTGNGFFDIYTVPLSMGIFSGPNTIPLYDVGDLLSVPYAGNVGSLPNLCKRYVDSAPMTTTVSAQQGAGSQVRAWPNPNIGFFMVQWNGTAGTTQARLLDATGRTLPGKWALHHGDNAMDISHVANGTYVLQLRNGDEVRHVRIMKQ